jgi:hypothetical protein
LEPKSAVVAASIMVPTAIVVSIQAMALASRLKGRTKPRSMAAAASAAAMMAPRQAGSSGGAWQPGQQVEVASAR